MTSRAGRKRVQGERTKGGRLKVAKDIPPGIAKREEWAKKSGVPVESASQLYDPEYGHVLGCLYLTASDEFPAYFLDASRKFAESLARYDWLTGFEPRTVKSPDYEKGYRGRAAGGNTQHDPELIREAVAAWQGVRSALTDKQFASIYNITILNMPLIGDFERKTAREAYEKLTAHFGLRPADMAQAA